MTTTFVNSPGWMYRVAECCGSCNYFTATDSAQLLSGECENDKNMGDVQAFMVCALYEPKPKV